MHSKPSKKEKALAFALGITVGIVSLVLLAALILQIPAVNDRYGWRVDFAMTYLRALVDPVKPLPTVDITQVAAVEGTQDPDLAEIGPVMGTNTPVPTAFATATERPEASPTVTHTPAPTFTPTPLPDRVVLDPPAYEEQEINNCGPATLAMHMRYYGWEGDQGTIASLIKPRREDRNVNVEELVTYVNTKTPYFEIQYRVGGDIETLKRLLAAGFPVTVEEGFIMEESYWLNDDRWAGHYLLLTGYDEPSQSFIVQDVFVGPDIQVPYDVLDKNWKAFNRVYILLYPPESRPVVQSILGDQWNMDTNRQHAVEISQAETEADPADAFAWFNLGTNLVYFEKYSQAAIAYDHARNAELPQRMLRYQFGPFFAYFHTGRMDDLLELTEYALKRTPNSEEAKLWRGWAMYREANREEALKLFNEALEARPGYTDAQYAINFVLNN